MSGYYMKWVLHYWRQHRQVLRTWRCTFLFQNKVPRLINQYNNNYKILINVNLFIFNKIIFYYVKKIDKSALFNLQNQTLGKVVLLLIFISKNIIHCWLFQKSLYSLFCNKTNLIQLFIFLINNIMFEFICHAVKYLLPPAQKEMYFIYFGHLIICEFWK